MPIAGVEAVASFPAELESPARARHFLRLEMGRVGVPEPPWDAALLLTSELVSNAVLHARTDLTVRVSTQPDCVRVEVADGNTRYPAAVETPLDATSGRGLHLVRSVAQTWGTDGTADGKIVWFELPITTQPLP